jgi:hypothetical protein
MNGETEYKFKRKFYYDIEKSINKTNVVFLLGPRRCGKTVSLLQLNRNIENAHYYNFKSMSDDESMALFDEIKDSMFRDCNKVYLLDEITYAFHPEREINEISVQLSQKPCNHTKIVFTGSQSVALEAWANRAFGGNVAMIYADFLNYGEWLDYKGFTEPTEENYNNFLYEIDKFYGFSSIEAYLKGCLEETIISNRKTDNAILGNDTYLVDVDTLLDICYATLFTLHNHVNSQSFAMNDKLSDSIKYYFRDICKRIGMDNVGELISQSFIGRYNDFRTRDLETLKQSFLFLHRTGLITITPVSDNLENIPNIYKDLTSTDSKINYKDELFNSYNICIKYPMFYVGILKDILEENMPEQLPTALLGSIVECNVRGLLSERGALEFQDLQGHEVDYVNVIKNIAIEITVSNKRTRDTNFRYLAEEYKNIVLSKDVHESKDNISIVPYYEFIKELDIGGI